MLISKSQDRIEKKCTMKSYFKKINQKKQLFENYNTWCWESNRLYMAIMVRGH